MVSGTQLASLRRGLVEYCVLAELDRGSTYGFDLVKKMQSQGLIAGESTLYPVLARLKANKLVESAWYESEEGRPRKYYTLTPLGRESLEAFRLLWPPLSKAVSTSIRKDDDE